MSRLMIDSGTDARQWDGHPRQVWRRLENWSVGATTTGRLSVFIKTVVQPVHMLGAVL